MKKHFELFSVDCADVSLRTSLKPTPAMVKTLMKCFKLEIDYPGKPYGPRDISGSFSGLYNRGLVDIKKINTKKNNSATSWFITNEGLHYLLSWFMKNKRLPFRIKSSNEIIN